MAAMPCVLMQASLAEAQHQLAEAQQEVSAQQAKGAAQNAKIGDLQDTAAAQSDAMHKAAQEASDSQQKLATTIDKLQVQYFLDLRKLAIGMLLSSLQCN